MEDLTWLITSSGVNKSVLALILMLPIVATFVTAARHLIGLKSFGMYTPILATFMFATVGIKFGMLLLVVSLLVGFGTRTLFEKMRIHYLSRISIVITTSTISILILLPLALRFGLSDELTSSVAVLPIVIALAISETFISTQLQKGTRTALYLLVETLVISFLSFLLLRWPAFTNFVTTYPLVIVVTLLVNILIGKWQGLRFSEVQRFRSIFKRLADEKR